MVWVHPTWRDLVIDRLGDDEEARRRFLSRCGAHGAALALSVGGGAEGERRLPLVRGDEDWDALSDRLHAVLPELEPQELVTVLRALRMAVGELASDRDGTQAQLRDRDRIRAELASLARIVLERAARTWDTAGEPIALPLLDAWLSLAAAVPDPPVAPALALTWAELLPARPPALDDTAEVQRLADWLVLYGMLRHLAPQLLGPFEPGADQLRIVSDFLDEVASELPTGRSEPVLRALEAAADCLLEVRGRASMLAGFVRQELGAAGELDSPRAGGGPGPAVPGEIEDEFSVRRVLADL